ncbi:MAG: hypothetical protein KDA93_16120, partial [Planctomycetaceae bacterium]|nr:hypothetical protein [Planctomycetaceae bacterium]
MAARPPAFFEPTLSVPPARRAASGGNAIRRFSGAASDGRERSAAPASSAGVGVCVHYVTQDGCLDRDALPFNPPTAGRDHPGAAVPSRGVSEAGWSRALARRRGALIE